jgi:molecular chaperone DnaK
LLYLGIDLGTTFSLVAYVNDHGLPTLFPDFHNANEFRTPSSVHIGTEGCLVGSSLEELLDDEPGLPQSRFFKLAMGTNAPVFEDNQQRKWWPQSLSALVLKKLINDVEAFAHEEIGGALIAVPAHFNNAQRRATKEAAHMAGISRVKLIEEPVAAATFYGYTSKMGEQTIFVYDLGGGTFDATVLQVGVDGLFALATEGSNTLGGKHIDDIIIRFILDDFVRQFGVEPKDQATLMYLRRFASESKLTLAKPGKNRISKTLVIAGHTMDFVLTQERFNQLIDKLVDDTLAVCERCLTAAGLEWSFIDSILLTGGSSLLPLVVDKVSRASGKPKDQLICKQPHQAVAYGAALLAAQQFKGETSAQKLQSICSYDLGIRTRGNNGEPAMKVMISKNSPVPAAAVTTFYTTREDQTRLIIEAVQRRSEGNSTEETSLGFFAFAIAQPRLRYPVEIELAYDLEGLVVVTARDPATGQKIQQVMDQDVEAMSRELLEQQTWINNLVINR